MSEKEERPSNKPAGGGHMRRMGGMSLDKPKHFKKSLGQLIKYLKPFYVIIFIGMFLVIAGTVCSLLGPKISTFLTNALQVSLYGLPIDPGKVAYYAILVLIIYALGSVFQFFMGFIFAIVSNRVSKRLRDELSEKINKMPLKYFDSNSYGDILSRVTNDIDTINQTLNQNLSSLLWAGISIVGIPIMMFTINWIWALIALCSLPLTLGLVMIVVKISQKYFRRQQQGLGDINGHVEEIYSAHNIVKVFNGEKKALETFSVYNDNLYTAAYKSQFLSGMMMPASQFVGNLTYAAVIIAAGLQMIASGSSLLGDLLPFLVYVQQFSQPMQQIATAANSLQSTAAASERVFEFLGEPEQLDESRKEIISLADYKAKFGTLESQIEVVNTSIFNLNKQKAALIEQSEENGKILALEAEINKLNTELASLESETTKYLTTIDNVKGKVEFKNVHFSYNPNREIIHDFSCVAKPGQKIAIVGPTGAGKTTLVNLLMRFYEIDSGEILIDDVPINKMSRTFVRRQFGMVLQDTWLFEGTIKENLSFGKPDATIEQIEEACKAASIDHFIKSLPGGYDMMLNEDSNLSIGEKQLFTIARAMVQNSPMLILDEATSSVDTRTEERIQKAMDSLMKNRTSFVIAHRLSTIKNADLILVMRDGDIVEKGTHKELIAKNGFYADLYNSQFSRAHKEEGVESDKDILKKKPAIDAITT